MDPIPLLAVAAGGALGAVARYLVGVGAARLWGLEFPWGTLTVNVVGCFTMGALAGAMASVWQPAPALRLFLTVGVLGGFTTFSSFALDLALLWQAGQTVPAILYLVGSVTLSVLALAAGHALARLVSP